MNSVSRVVPVLGAGVAIVVWGNAVAMDAYCVQHPRLVSCDDARTPLPQQVDEITQLVTQASTTASVAAISTVPVAEGG
jgi:hypothetical protein